MGAQLQISCSAVLHFFRMNSKGLKPPPLGVEFLFHFKHHPASFELKSHPRILQAFSTRKSGAKNLLLCNPAFYCSLASSIVTDDKQQLNTSYLPPFPPSFSQPPFFTILTRGLLIIFQTSMGGLQKPTSAAMKRSFA